MKVLKFAQILHQECDGSVSIMLNFTFAGNNFLHFVANGKQFSEITHHNQLLPKFSLQHTHLNTSSLSPISSHKLSLTVLCW